MNKNLIFGGSILLLFIIGGGVYAYSVKKSAVIPTDLSQTSGTTSESVNTSNKIAPSHITTQVTQSKTMSYLPNLAPVNVESEGKHLEYQFGTFDPAIHLGNISGGDLNTTSPVQTLALYYSLLAKGDIAGASKISSDPAKTSATLTAYQDRLGNDSFKKQYAEGFSPASSVTVSGIAKVGNDTYIVFLKTDSYTGANVFINSDGSYSLADDPSTLPQNVQDVLQYLTNQFNS
ncbi:hypothetical protein BH11PAT2_BH11PAT2_06130 [soil metagenome]